MAKKKNNMVIYGIVAAIGIYMYFSSKNKKPTIFDFKTDAEAANYFGISVDQASLLRSKQK